MPGWSSLVDEALIAARSIADYAAGTLNPTLRLGVTGLSRAGKTVFITAMVQALVEGGRLPVFRAQAEGRVARASLSPQPDDTVPRFDYETHLADLVGPDRRWPDSTRQISELRLTIEFQSARRFGSAMSTLTLDIVDYPGEWLLDLPLLQKSYAEWSAETLAASRAGSRPALARDWHGHLAGLDPDGPADETAARMAAQLFTAYLRAGRDERYALSTLPPGRFLMPGDLDGSPALTFAPLDLSPGSDVRPGSLRAMMERRYEAYKQKVVKPFFVEHFARLDRQVVLVDALAAFNAGPQAVRDLETALASVLSAFRVGANSWLSALFRPRVQRILFAATKADHLHHTSHDRLEAILRRLADAAIERAAFAGAAVDVVALASVRATREATVKQGRESLPCIIGTPVAGERSPTEVFDGTAEIAVFPGELPADPQAIFSEATFAGLESGVGERVDYRFIRFRPPLVEPGRVLPHIRLDRALEFLIGDKLA
ncbi:YcjX family protein [Labrys wisconsinensis]|uniref:YcjX-like family ATPase n=1 Tax=Labrys wisconsinensis TaxID=425677 RepID=A0ABU0JFI2_9HYPH|nr:YcjX family protein [Labrys wisconsinensis]MDQ0473052.1 putative YcjX-like family ATPase [Labrys wisconsinensis]